MSQRRVSLAQEWRRLARAATSVALLTAPRCSSFSRGLPAGAARLAHRHVLASSRSAAWSTSSPTVHPGARTLRRGGALLERDVVDRRRVWFWRTSAAAWTWIVAFFLLSLQPDPAVGGHDLARHRDTWSRRTLFVQFLPQLHPHLSPAAVPAELRHPLRAARLLRHQADEGLRARRRGLGRALDDVRGQAEPKEDVTRVISLWQAGEEFRAAGGKPERGLLFIGAPGTGKTMLSKAIATSFNSPIMTMPGSGFALDVHGHGRRHRAHPHRPGAAPGPQVGRPVHHLHRRDRRRRAAPPGARRAAASPGDDAGRRRAAAHSKTSPSTGRWARSPPAATSCSRRAPGAKAVRRAGRADARPAAAVLARAGRQAPGLHVPRA